MASRWFKRPDEVSDLSVALEPYVDHLRRFVAGELSADDFAEFYDRVYLADQGHVTVDVFDAMDRMFAEVDAYVSDPELRPHVYRSLGPEELRAGAKRLLDKAGLGDPDPPADTDPPSANREDPSA